MRESYPVILSKGSDLWSAEIPDFNITVFGSDKSEALFTARDAIGLMGIDMEFDRQPIPKPSVFETVREANPQKTVSLVAVDFEECRRDIRTGNRDCRIDLPWWLDDMAKKYDINVTSVLHKAVINELYELLKPKKQTDQNEEP